MRATARDLVPRRDAGAEVQELADPRFSGQEAHRPTKEHPVRAGSGDHVEVNLHDLLPDRPVGGEVVLPRASNHCFGY
jgi:hypothetical protein